MPDPTGKLGHDSGHAEEASFLQAYRSQEYPKPSVTVDLVIFTVIDSDLKVLLIKRGGHPYKDCWAVPGGFVKVGDGYDDQGESLEEAAERELVEETGIEVTKHEVYLEQLYTFGKPGRDPRMRVISVAYYALVRPGLAHVVQAGTDASEAEWVSVNEMGENLAFDHDNVVGTAIQRIRGKLDYSPIGFQLVPKTFTVAELRAVYEAVQGRNYDPGNFRRRFKRMQTDGIIEPAPGKRQTLTKPAKVYRFVMGGRFPGSSA